MALHVAEVMLTPVNALGVALSKTTASTGAVMTASTEMIVQVDATFAPNADGQQNIKEYLVAEDDAGFHIRYMGNNYIVTSDTA